MTHQRKAFSWESSGRGYEAFIVSPCWFHGKYLKPFFEFHNEHESCTTLTIFVTPQPTV